MTFEEIKNSDRLLYHYIAGSTLYHCNEEGSDVDTKGLYIATKDELFGLGFDKKFRDSKEYIPIVTKIIVSSGSEINL